LKTREQFREFCRAQLRDDLYELEKVRKKVYTKICGLSFAVGAVLFTAIGLFAASVQNPGPLILAAVGTGIFAVLMGKYLSRDYRLAYKFMVMRRVVKFVDESLDYDPMGFIKRPIYMMSKLYTTKPDEYKGDDLIAGKVGATEIQFCELHTQFETHDKNGRHLHTIFRGLFFLADFNKNFNTRTIVLPDLVESKLGGVGRFFQKFVKPFGELIRMDDPQFEREFKVYSEDQVEARYILSPALMQRITEFKERTKKDIRLSFIGTKVFVAVSYKRALFEPSITKTVLDFDLLLGHLRDIQLAVGIVEDLNLNTRIWSKA